MAIDLTPRWDKFAVYLPAMQYHYASAVKDNKPIKGRDFPTSIKFTDLDFLNPTSKLWHYGYALYSAGQFPSARPKACAVTNRDREKTIVLGDSGGFQIGQGTLKGTEHFKKAKTSSEICQMWRDSGDTRKRILNWLDAHSDYAMTIDMPLWARLPQFKHTPFHKCSVQELIDLSVDNLKYIKANTNGDTKWLNVIQGTNHNDWKLWWNAVKKYKFNGWALAGSVGWRGIAENKDEGVAELNGLQSVLQMVLTMRDENAFARGQDWLHVLGVSQPTWAVLFTAIQRSIRKHCKNPNMRVSYDSASPFQTGGARQQVVRYPKFTKDFATWTMSAHEAPVNPIYAKSGKDFHFPYASPLGDLLTLNHLNVRGGEFQRDAYDAVSNHILTNHNVWVYVRGLLEANELAFMHVSEADKAVPQKLLDVCAFIEDIFSHTNWQAKVKKEKKLFDEVMTKLNYKDVAQDDEIR